MGQDKDSISCRYPAGSTRQILAFATALHAGRTRKIPTRDGRTATGSAPGVIRRSVESAFAKLPKVSST